MVISSQSSSILPTVMNSARSQVKSPFFFISVLSSAPVVPRDPLSGFFFSLFSSSLTHLRRLALSSVAEIAKKKKQQQVDSDRRPPWGTRASGEKTKKKAASAESATPTTSRSTTATVVVVVIHHLLLGAISRV